MTNKYIYIKEGNIMARTRLNERQLDTVGDNNLATDDEINEAIILHKSDVHPHTQYLTETSANTLFELNNSGDEQITNRGVANGYAPLDANGLIPTAAIPVSSVVTIVQSVNMDGGTY